MCFQVGEQVYVKLRPYRQLSVARRINQKLAPRFFGPFEIVERIGPVAYRLQLPPSSKVHPVFHVSLKKAVPGTSREDSLPAEFDLDMADRLIPEAIRATRFFNHQGDTVLQWLIQWKGRSLEEGTWEDALTIQSQFPEAGLEDKTIFEGEPNDANNSKVCQLNPSSLSPLFGRSMLESPRPMKGVSYDLAL